MDKYNFDVKEMIDNFSLEDFFLSKDNTIEKEAFLLITNNQYILGYSKSYGFGDYNEAISNCIREIYELKQFTYRREIDNISDIIKGNFITAKMSNSEKNGVYLYFNVNECNNISENQLQLFKDFFDKYNDTIREYSDKKGYPVVRYYLPNNRSYVNDYGFVEDETFYESNDLTSVLEVFEKKTDCNKVVPEENIIIGEKIKSKEKNKVKSKIKSYTL